MDKSSKAVTNSTRHLCLHDLLPAVSCTAELQDISSIVAPIMESQALQRLEHISFLGILSAKYTDRSIIYQALEPSARSDGVTPPYVSDGSRLEHSLAVAILLNILCKKFDFSISTRRYAIVWGLLHDVGTWPLSHTGEAAFSRITNISAGELRRKIVLGSKELPTNLTVSRQLCEIGVDSNILSTMFEQDCPDYSGDLCNIYRVVRSPLTPDTLEGVWRTGCTCGIDVPSPVLMLQLFSFDLFGPVLAKTKVQQAIEFWRKKSMIYREFINHKMADLYESKWSFNIMRAFSKAGLAESMMLSEQDVVSRVLEIGLKRFSQQLRYKPPHIYYVGKKIGKRGGDIPFEQLSRILRKRRSGA